MRRQLTGAAAALVTAALVSLAGCSGATPLSGASSAPLDASSVSASSPSASPDAASGTAGSVSSPSSGATALPGLSTGCTAAVHAQAGVADVFGRAVDGTKLTAKDVSTVFDAISADVPAALSADLATLRDAATRSVGKSDVAVAEILQEKKVGAARDALSDYVQECSPPTS